MVIFLDAGVYVVTDTLKIPAGTQVVGEAWSVIAGKGANFQNELKPRPVVQVGTPGSVGTVEITDVIFSTIGRELDQFDFLFVSFSDVTFCCVSCERCYRC